MENQMERSVLLEITRGKRNTLGIPFFLVLSELLEYHCTICAVILVPCVTAFMIVFI